MSRVGIIESIDNEAKIISLIGFGVFVGNEMVENEDIGIEVEVPRIELDTGSVFINSNGYYWASEEVIKADLEEYINKGYEIKY